MTKAVCCICKKDNELNEGIKYIYRLPNVKWRGYVCKECRRQNIYERSMI